MNKIEIFNDLKSFRKMYFYLKQLQWFYFGNNNVLSKLETLMKLYSFQNLLKDLND